MKTMMRIALCMALFMGASAAFAVDLESAKADGLVGERADGYLGAVKGSVSAEVQALIDDINGKRNAEFKRIAKQYNLTLHDVELMAGKKAIDKTVDGNWVFIDSWQRK